MFLNAYHLGHNDSSQGADITVLELLVKEKSEPCWFKYLKHKQHLLMYLADQL